jgi:hypothetical protein
MKTISDSSRSSKSDTESELTDSSVLIERTRQIKSNVNDNHEDFEGTCINTATLILFLRLLLLLHLKIVILMV